MNPNSTNTKIENKSIRKQIRKDFHSKKKEMNKLFKDAYGIYANDLKTNKKKNYDDLRQIKTEFKNSQKTINLDFHNKKITINEKHSMLSISSKKFIESLESYKSMMKNRKLAAISEHKRRLSQIKKTYMNDVIKHQLSFLWKRFVFGLNKEFSRVTWWSKKRTFLDFAIIIIIVTILALIFMGLDMAVLPIEHYK